MPSSLIKAVIMAGGSGTRLWPLSRTGHPKQFLSLQGTGTMLQQTIRRLEGLPIGSLVTICNEEHRFFVAEQLRAIDKLGSIILEPVGRNTAPALALAALTEKDGDQLLLVMPADHLITDVSSFHESVMTAIPIAEQGKLVMFGIIPSQPLTGYGYIKAGKELGDGFQVDKFVEKPNRVSANKFLDQGGYYWNSGIFLFKASRYLEELKNYRPDIFDACNKSVAKVVMDIDFLRVDPILFAACPDDSIDYAVMENTPDSVVVPMDAGWNDIGSWSSLWDISEKDDNGNAISGDVILQNARNSYIRSDDKLVAAVGIDSLVVVSTKDALLIADKDRVQDIKLITEKLQDDGRSEWEFHREVFRPWGKYDLIDHGYQYQVKRISVKPGAKLSVQMHHHRAEHWVVVSGLARVTNGDNTFLLSQNESTYIPSGVIHSLENPGEAPLEIIEIQSGTYLGEDDIIRFEDRYGRVEK